MKKKLSLMAVAAITAFTMSVNAQNPKGDQQNCPEGRCAKTEQCCKQQKQCKQQKLCNVSPDSLPAFKGIQLTEAQKTRIVKIRTDMQAARKAKAEAAKADKSKKDQAARADKKARAEARMQAKLDYLHQVQQVLTPEQYITFLENTAVMNGGGQHKGAPRQGVRQGKKDQKGDKQMSRREGRKDNAKGQQRPERKDKMQKSKSVQASASQEVK